ncbi:hydroxyisourate hydrolase [uncultured Friedmanniella sp.]|uniref:hydroxyisourate hydrolase n=1 Tax=uncultured Friedmanniella sp. TaxID=335381 RepID=UPI0035CA6EBB
MTRSRVTTHVLDAVSGGAAVGVSAQLDGQVGADGWLTIANGTTDDDGRIADLGPADLESGRYRITFDTGTYFREAGTSAFYPEVVLTFTVDDRDAHYHVPLLLSPFAYSTYRGS